MDVRPGGARLDVMHGPDGTDYPGKSVFTEVVKPEHIAFSHGGGRKGARGVRFESTWTFDAIDDGTTRVTIRMVFPMADDRDRVAKEYRAVEGGEQTLARLAGHLAKAPVVVEKVFDASPEVVWKAITNRDQMKAWYFENLNSFKPEVGFQTQFNVRAGDKDYLHLWTVTAVVPGRKLAYAWKYAGYPGESLVTFGACRGGGTDETHRDARGPGNIPSRRPIRAWRGATSSKAGRVLSAPRWRSSSRNGSMRQGFKGTLDQLAEYLVKL